MGDVIDLRTVCEPCRDRRHEACVDMDGEYGQRCRCSCIGVVACDSCGNPAALFVDPVGPARGHCCSWLYLDDGAQVVGFDLNQPREVPDGS